MRQGNEFRQRIVIGERVEIGITVPLEVAEVFEEDHDRKTAVWTANEDGTFTIRIERG